MEKRWHFQIVLCADILNHLITTIASAISLIISGASSQTPLKLPSRVPLSPVKTYPIIRTLPSVKNIEQPYLDKLPCDHNCLMSSAGISAGDFGYVDYIVSHESGWNVSAYNPSGATGLCQSLPGSKMASAGADWLTNPVTQLRWCNSYAQSTYGGWAGAYSHWVSAHVW